ncbi:transposase [Arthrobacter globiformis]|uniref:transposase n=1 Tax=Arthrobacter globiformis TaxID=1665 RepID=UPI00358E1885
MAGLPKNVLATALEEEMTEYLGHERHWLAENGNVRKGPGPSPCSRRSAPCQTDVPRDGEGSFEPQMVMRRIATVTLLMAEEIPRAEASLSISWPVIPAACHGSRPAFDIKFDN